MGGSKFQGAGVVRLKYTMTKNQSNAKIALKRSRTVVTLIVLADLWWASFSQYFLAIA